MTRMKLGFGLTVMGVALALASSVAAQTSSPPQNASSPQSSTMSPEDTTRSAKATASGDTGLFFIPTAEILPHKKFSFSLYRTNIDDGQGFSDISHFPVTFGVGVKDRLEVFGAFNLLTRIDRDTVPLFFTATGPDGTGGGITANHPLNRDPWISKMGDLRVGAKFNFTSEADEKASAFALRGLIKIPTGDTESGASSGKMDFEVDAILSKELAKVAELSGYAGYLVRGNPEGYELTDSIKYGAGLGFPTRSSLGLTFTAEAFGEFYRNKTITAPAGLKGIDGSPVPTSSLLKNPFIVSLGATWQAPNGFFIGASGSWNLTMKSRNNAGSCLSCNDSTLDEHGFNVRIGYHPGVRKFVPPPPPIQPTITPPPVIPPPAVNRPPTVRATCDPCTVEVGKTSTVAADAQDPDGDALTYAWRAPSGSLTSATNRQTPWTAPMTEGPVTLTVTVNDGKGGTASATTTINVVKPVMKEIVFEDVHFDFDRSTLRPDALRVLDEAIAALQANPNLKLEIEGHTCNIGTAEYNLALGERRGKTVLDYLAGRGIGADRLRTVSYGEERPKYDNSREETRRLNRRAALVVRVQ